MLWIAVSPWGMRRPIRGASAACVAFLAVGCGGRTSGSSGSTSGGVGVGSVVASAGVTAGTGVASGSSANAGVARGSSGTGTAGGTVGGMNAPPPGEADATADSIDSGSDSSNGECGTGMTVLSCTTSNGIGETCLSSDPTQCPGPDPVLGAGAWVCQSLCQAGEYAVGWTEQAPAGCRDIGAIPGLGGGSACCPCGAEDAGTNADATVFDSGVDAALPPSCAPGGPGMTNCGPGGSGTESCCTSLGVTGGTYTSGRIRTTVAVQQERPIPPR